MDGTSAIFGRDSIMDSAELFCKGHDGLISKAGGLDPLRLLICYLGIPPIDSPAEVFLMTLVLLPLVLLRLLLLST